MIRINLLPSSIEEKGRVREQVFLFLICLGILAGVMVWFRSYQLGQIQDLETRIQETQKKLNAEKKKLAEIDKINKQIETIEKKLEVIGLLDLRRREAFRLLDTLTGMVVENRMWLNSFQALEKTRTITKGKGKTATKEVSVSIEVTIEGMALDNKTVADFMTRVEQSKDTEGIFKITEASLDMLKQENLPDSIMKQLDTLKDKEHKGANEMIAALKDTIGKDPTTRYGPLISRTSGEEYFDEENLVYVRQETYGNINMKRFQITCKHMPLKKKADDKKKSPPKGKKK